MDTEIASMARTITTPMKQSLKLSVNLSVLPPLLHLYRLKCLHQTGPPHLQRHHHQPEEIPHHERALPPKPPSLSFVAPQMERRILRSVLVEGADHYCPSNGSKQVRSESCEHAYDASSLRKPAIRESLVLVVSLHMHAYGRCLVL